jgi:hypothetical protein
MFVDAVASNEYVPLGPETINPPSGPIIPSFTPVIILVKSGEVNLSMLTPGILFIIDINPLNISTTPLENSEWNFVN